MQGSIKSLEVATQSGRRGSPPVNLPASPKSVELRLFAPADMPVPMFFDLQLFFDLREMVKVWPSGSHWNWRGRVSLALFPLQISQPLKLIQYTLKKTKNKKTPRKWIEWNSKKGRRRPYKSCMMKCLYTRYSYNYVHQSNVSAFQKDEGSAWTSCLWVLCMAEGTAGALGLEPWCRWGSLFSWRLQPLTAVASSVAVPDSRCLQGPLRGMCNPQIREGFLVPQLVLQRQFLQLD